MIEEVEELEERISKPSFGVSAPTPVTDIKAEESPRIPIGVGEIDRVLGGGIVKGSCVLLGGDPGIGKSTLVLQISEVLAEKGFKVLYASAEESMLQTKLRAERLGVKSPNLYILSEASCDVINFHLENFKPTLITVDSIQMIYNPNIPSSAGSIVQVRECAMELIQACKRLETSLFIIGHVTKEGAIAGPRMLEHMVDAVFYFEGDRFQNYRLLRGVKNRFGSTNEIGIFEMTGKGLLEVRNPSELFIRSDRKNLVGSVVVPTVMGSRTLLVELQALTSRTGIGIPARKVTGVDQARLGMIVAVLERRCGLHLGMQDIFVNAVGGVEISETACDLGIALVIASNFKGKAIDSDLIAIGEIGLGGEIRSVSYITQRLTESARLGFKKAIIPKDNLKNLPDFADIKIEGVNDLRSAIEIAKIS
jgi:DNA repair protein RadA/Sms